MGRHGLEFPQGQEPSGTGIDPLALRVSELGTGGMGAAMFAEGGIPVRDEMNE